MFVCREISSWSWLSVTWQVRSKRELVEVYGIARGTVSEILKRHGVARQRGLRREQVDEAVQ